MTKIQSASGGSNVLDIEYWNFEFICYLGIVIWDLKNHPGKEAFKINSSFVSNIKDATPEPLSWMISS